jgi:hypothetical protein
MNNLSMYIYMSQKNYTGSCKCKKFGGVSVNDLELTRDIHIVYTAIDTYMHNTSLDILFVLPNNNMLVGIELSQLSFKSNFCQTRIYRSYDVSSAIKDNFLR